MSSVDKMTFDDLHQHVDDLLAEIETALSSDRWLITENGSKSSRLLLHQAGSLRHCSRLLQELWVASEANLEMTLRIVGRAHIEALLFGLYLHYGGEDALLRIAASTKKSNISLSNDLEQWNTSLFRRRSEAEEQTERIRRRIEYVKEHNLGAEVSERILNIEEPYVPRAIFAEEDLGAMRSSPQDVDPGELKVINVVHELSLMGQELGFSKESFLPIYHIYRVLSSVGPHPTLYVYEHYIRHSRGSMFGRTEMTPESASSRGQTLVNATFSTAILAEAVLGGKHEDVQVAHRVRRLLEPDVGATRGWTPAV